MIVDDLFEHNKKKLDEVDPRNFDSDVDYYAAQNAPAKRRSAPSDYPYSQEEDDDYFREIFRKKREAAKKAEQDKESGVAEANSVTDQGGAINPDTGKAYTPDEVDAWLEKDKIQRELLPKIKAQLGAQPGGAYDLSQPVSKMLSNPQATLPTATAAPGAPGTPSKVSYGQGFTKPAAPKPTAVPNYSRQAPGYNYTTSVTPTAAPARTRVTAGGPTAAEKAALDKRIAAAAKAQPVAETVKQVKRMMETVTTKADVQRIKDYIDHYMGTNLTESAQLKRNRLLSEVTQLAAVRRREIARRMA